MIILIAAIPLNHSVCKLAHILASCHHLTLDHLTVHFHLKPISIRLMEGKKSFSKYSLYKYTPLFTAALFTVARTGSNLAVHQQTNG